MNLKLIPICIAAVFTLSACDKLGSFGFSVDKTESTGSDQSKSISKDRSITINDSAQINIKMPAAALISAAMSEFLAQEGIKPPFRRIFISSNSNLASKVLPSTSNSAYLGTALAISATSEPALGWPRYIDDRAFMYRSAAMTDFANQIETELISKIGNSSIKNQADAKAKIILALGQISPEDLENIYANCVITARSALLTQDLTGSSSPIQFKAGDSVISASGDGFKVSKNGINWFGGGVLSGKSYDISMSSSLSTALNQRLDLGDKSSNSSSETAKISADIKN